MSPLRPFLAGLEARHKEAFYRVSWRERLSFVHRVGAS